MIDVVPNAGVISLGKQGENQAVRVTLPNIRAGSGSILLLHQRSDDQKPYPVPVVEAGGAINLHYPALDDGYELAVPSETEIMVDVAKVVGTDG